MRLHRYSAGAGAGLTYPDVDPHQRLAELLELEADAKVFIVGTGVEIDINMTLIEVFGDEPGHLLTHFCRQLQVTAEYTGRPAHFPVHPAALVSAVLDEAVDKLKIDATTAADLVLRLPGSNEDLVPTRPIGAYAAKDECKIVVDLVHAVRPQG